MTVLRDYGLFLRLVSWVLAACLWAPAVRADVVVLVPPHAEPGVPHEQIERALEALARALRVDGFDVVSAGQAAAIAESDPKREQRTEDFDPANCVTPECAFEFRQLFDASFAVQTSLFRDGQKLSSVTVTIVEHAAAYFTGASEIEGGDIEGGVRIAYKRAREKQAEGVGPWLTVQGKPEGASVYVDGAEFGRIPIVRRRLGPGTHTITVRADGYATMSEALEIPARLDHEEAFNVALSPLGRAGRRRHVADWIIGSALMAGGLVYAIAGAVDYARDGDCAERAGGVCTGRYEADTTSTLKLGIGSGVTVLGAAYLWWAPIGLAASASRDSAALSARIHF